MPNDFSIIGNFTMNSRFTSIERVPQDGKKLYKETCKDCGKEEDRGELEGGFYNGEYICKKCMCNYDCCTNCGHLINEENSAYTSSMKCRTCELEGK